MLLIGVWLGLFGALELGKDNELVRFCSVSVPGSSSGSALSRCNSGGFS